MSDSRVWLITGTSSGIGKASVKEVIAAGERVAAITRKASSVSDLTYPSDKLVVVEYDVGNPTESAEVLFEKVHRHFGRIDVVVNNAGYGLNSVVEGTSDEEARYQFEVNFWGAVRISREAVKYFREHVTPAGRIINVSSVGGFAANPTLAFYSASKFALEGFSEGLHKELLPEWNIKVIVVQPGGVRTEWAKSNMVDRPLPPVYDTPESPANRMRGVYKSTPYIGDAVKRKSTLFGCHDSSTDILVIHISRALIAISREANPPLRLPLGADSRFLILHKLDEIKKNIEQWNELTLSSIADDVDPLTIKKFEAGMTGTS